MSDHSHPYTNLPKYAFWKTAVADLDPRQIDLAWKPKSPITRATTIITVGSCFAQHISRSLKENGFNWLDSEPAPAALPPEIHATHGYGVFSFRTGNIYTAALLKQWVMWAAGKAEQSTESFLNDGRFFDPFRPSLTVEGFSSAEAMLAAKQVTLAAMLEAFRRADLFIFTLGLTEAWLNKDGPVYPMCPGTIRGRFSAAHHAFHNYNERDVVRDLAETFDELRRINPSLRFLLTVSPVPLTATASGQHVLTATTYSKSVLRSAAGHLAQIREDVDYFHSYELITASALKGQFYEQNMRSVSSEGVAFVMRQFLGAIGAVATPATPEISFGAKAVNSNGTEKAESGTDICDDIILETWANKAVDHSEDSPNILLLGDSQMGMFAKVFDEQGIRYAGGAIMHGSDWHTNQFILDDDLVFNALPKHAKTRWDDAFSIVQSRPIGSKRSDLFVITDIGAHSGAALTKEYGIYGSQFVKRGPDGYSITADDILSYLNFTRVRHFALLKTLVKAGFHIVWVSDPPLYKGHNLELQLFMERILGNGIASIGASVFLSGEWVEGIGGFRSEFISSDIDPLTGEPDKHHGSLEYYRQLTKKLFNRFSITPRYREAVGT